MSGSGTNSAMHTVYSCRIIERRSLLNSRKVPGCHAGLVRGYDYGRFSKVRHSLHRVHWMYLTKNVWMPLVHARTYDC